MHEHRNENHIRIHDRKIMNKIFKCQRKMFEPFFNILEFWNRNHGERLGMQESKYFITINPCFIMECKLLMIDSY